MSDNIKQTGADVAINALANAGVEVCFMNPGTSEMHFVSAIDNCNEIRSVLGLYEGVVTGAADGYGRIKGKPALTLLHLGAGFANGISNLHNARRASTPIVNIIGDHAVSHQQYDAPLASDIAALSSAVSYKTYSVKTSVELGKTCVDAYNEALKGEGRITTLIVPANCAWEIVTEKPSNATAPNTPEKPNAKDLDKITALLKSNEKCMLLLGGNALGAEGLETAGKIAHATGCALSSPTFSKKRLRGQGVVRAERLPYFGDMVMGMLANVKHLILVGAKAPVSFFAYENQPSDLVPEGCSVHTLADMDGDANIALASLAEALSCIDGKSIAGYEAPLPTVMDGKLDGFKIGAALAQHMPEGCIVSDESNTNGIAMRAMTINAKPHTWMDLTGGSIGQGLPLAVGAAIAAPDSKILALQSDGSAMYTLQSLWTIAREDLDITIVLFSNRSYAILNVEFAKMGLMANAGEDAAKMMSLDKPEIDFVALAKGMGVDAARAETAEEFNKLIEKSLNTKGAFLIDAIIDPPM